jgi:hypothetical protein
MYGVKGDARRDVEWPSSAPEARRVERRVSGACSLVD